MDTKHFQYWCLIEKPYVPRMTNMVVEAFFKSLKHTHLKKKRTFRLDTILYILNKKVVEHYEDKLKKRVNVIKTGRDLVNTLPSWKRKCLEEINELIKKDKTPPLNDEYRIDLILWTCTCGKQKYSPHFMCRHLVRYFLAQYGEEKKTLLAYLSEKRTSIK